MSTNQQVLGHYELQQRLSGDTLTENWKAFDTQQQRYVILKTLRVPPQASPEFLNSFLGASRSLLSLHHPNIAAILDIQAITEAPTPGVYIVTDYIDGPSLADYLHINSHQGRFPQGVDLVRMLTPIAAALDYAHQQNIVHGSIKPSAIVLDKHVTPEVSKLTDFGVHHLYNPRALPLEDTYYIAPELAQGQYATDRSDLYSLGVVLYELCTGVVPFQGDTPAEIMVQHIHNTPSSPIVFNPQLPPAMTAVIMRSLSKDPAARFSSAAALIAAIARAYHLPTQTTPSSSGMLANSYDAMNNPTYLSPGPISRPGVAATPIVAPPSFSQAPTTASTPQRAVATTPTLNVSTPSIPPSAPRRRSNRAWYVTTIVVLVVILLSGAIGAYLLLFNIRPFTSPPSSTSPTVVGHAYFVSSGLLGLVGNQGIADGMKIDLQNIPDPQAGKRYYAWLLNDNDANLDTSPILLGALTVDHGRVSLPFTGNAQHNNLLINYSRFLITEEDANATPTNPSLDATTHRYAAFFSQKGHVSGPTPQYSLLDHIRHLLAQDPKLQAAGLTGGLSTWLFKNSEKILEWSGSARDALQHGDTAFARRQLLRILDYLDGAQFVATEPLPADLKAQPVIVDPVIARVALLTISDQQNPPGYLKHIGNHLREIVTIPDTTPDQRALAVKINTAINNVVEALTAVHVDTVNLLKLDPAAMTQPSALTTMNHLTVQANNAFVGQIDPNTNTVREGVVQIYYAIQRLATFDITACQGANQANPCA